MPRVCKTTTKKSYRYWNSRMQKNTYISATQGKSEEEIANIEKDLMAEYFIGAIDGVHNRFHLKPDVKKLVLAQLENLPPIYYTIIRRRAKGESIDAIGALFNPKKNAHAIADLSDIAMDLMYDAIQEDHDIMTSATQFDDNINIANVPLIASQVKNYLSSVGYDTIGDIRRIKTLGNIKEMGFPENACVYIMDNLNAAGFSIKNTLRCPPVGGYHITGSIVNKRLRPNYIKEEYYVHCNTKYEVFECMAYLFQKESGVVGTTMLDWFINLADSVYDSNAQPINWFEGMPKEEVAKFKGKHFNGKEGTKMEGYGMDFFITRETAISSRKVFSWTLPAYIQEFEPSKKIHYRIDCKEVGEYLKKHGFPEGDNKFVAEWDMIKKERNLFQ